MQKPTISVPEMAAELGIGLTKAYQLVHEPNFPTIRIGTRILMGHTPYGYTITNGIAVIDKTAATRIT